MGETYGSMHQYDKALNYYTQSLAVLEKIQSPYINDFRNYVRGKLADINSKSKSK
ncbi:MAG: tetratricopeptide repeat protein [Desulfobulbus sp.]|nr:tetratricopeptide repeat protein [Desulfobulbus sp.]